MPLLIGSRPLFNGRKAPPQPAIPPQKIGPKTGKPNTLGAIFFAAKPIRFTATLALKVSNKTMKQTVRICDEVTISLTMGK